MASLYKRDRIWWASYYRNGKRIRRPLDPDKREAEKKLADIISQKDDGKYGITDRGILWETFRDKYLLHSRGNKLPATHHNDRMAIRSLEKYRMPQKLSDLTPEFLEGWKAYRKDTGKKAQTINRELGAMKALIRKSVEWGYLSDNGWYGVKKVKYTKTKLLFYTPKELKALLDECEEPYKTIALLASRAGLRRSEAYHLAWVDTDFERRRLHVCPKEGWNPKGYKQRWVPLPEDLYTHLRSLEPRKTGPWVLEQRPSMMAVSLRFRRILKRIGLKGTLHTLRHTYASHLVQAGVDIYTVSKLLGHSNIKITEIYVHLAPDSMAKAVAKLPDL